MFASVAGPLPGPTDEITITPSVADHHSTDKTKVGSSCARNDARHSIPKKAILRYLFDDPVQPLVGAKVLSVYQTWAGSAHEFLGWLTMSSHESD